MPLRLHCKMIHDRLWWWVEVKGLPKMFNTYIYWNSAMAIKEAARMYGNPC